MQRRHFLRASSLAACAAAWPGIIVPRRAWASPHERLLDQAPMDRADRKALTQRALDAARSAGATYADVQLRVARTQPWQQLQPLESVVLTANVRALVNGYWGFVSVEGVPTLESMAKLGREAVAQAKTGALGKPRTVELAPAPVVPDGDWTMPIQVDPFTVANGEKVDFMLGLTNYVDRHTVGVGSDITLVFRREDQTFASSEGSFITQRIYTTEIGLVAKAEVHFATYRGGMQATDFSGPLGAGWEVMLRAPFQDHVDELIDRARRMREPKPVDIGRHDIVFDANAMAKILDGTIGTATRLDRAMGYNANFEGTSFLNESAEMLGTFQIAAPRVTVSANRSMPGGAANTKWDDEGVATEEITLVKEGVLHEFQTTRESASWLADAYRKAGRPVRSHGCGRTYTPKAPTMAGPTNLVLQPGSGTETFESLVASTKKGLAIMGGRVAMDQQCLNGAGSPDIMREIVDGKLGAVIGGANYLLRAPEFWKKVAVLGGKSSAYMIGFNGSAPPHLRGATVGGSPYSVSAVPAKVTEVAIIDVMRRGA